MSAGPIVTSGNVIFSLKTFLAAMLAYPADFRASKSLGDHQHVFFPLGIETASLFPPLKIPVPNTGEYEKPKAQLAKRYAETSYCAIR